MGDTAWPRLGGDDRETLLPVWVGAAEASLWGLMVFCVVALTLGRKNIPAAECLAPTFLAKAAGSESVFDPLFLWAKWNTSKLKGYYILVCKVCFHISQCFLLKRHLFSCRLNFANLEIVWRRLMVVVVVIHSLCNCCDDCGKKTGAENTQRYCSSTVVMILSPVNNAQGRSEHYYSINLFTVHLGPPYP